MSTPGTAPAPTHRHGSTPRRNTRTLITIKTMITRGDARMRPDPLLRETTENMTKSDAEERSSG